MPYKPKEVLKVLLILGFIKHHQSGSHLILKHPDGRRTVLPMHNVTMKRGLFHSILKDARISEKEFRERV
jgi:predicted RNA binding protein YcfA (HicA-like mRNA interferase family)